MTSIGDERNSDADLQAFSESLISQTVGGRYVVERIIGTGGMGVVAAARHTELDQYAAVKFVRPEFANNSMVSARFIREAKVAAKVRGQHLVRVFDAGKMETGVPYLVMEMLQGHSLQDELKTRVKLPIEDVVDWMLQTCAGLAELHGQNIIHRDLKPTNLFLAQEGGGTIVKVLDFGISKDAGGEGPAITGTSALIGTPHYMSPEQIRAPKTVDARSDIWALGVIMYELLTGEVPFVSFAETAGEIFGLVLFTDPKVPTKHRPDIPAPIEDIILKCLRKNRDERFSTVSELAEALGPYAPAIAAHRINAVARALGSSPSANPSAKRMASASAPTKAERAGKSNPSGPVAAAMTEADSHAETQEHPSAKAISVAGPDSVGVEAVLPTEAARRGVVRNPVTGAHAHWTSDTHDVPKRSRRTAIVLGGVLAFAAIGTAAVAISLKQPEASATTSVSRAPQQPTTANLPTLGSAPSLQLAPTAVATDTPEAKPSGVGAHTPVPTASARPSKMGPTPRTTSAPAAPPSGGKNDALLLDRK